MTQDLRLAIIINPALPMGLIANTVAALSIGLGAKLPALGAQRLTDMSGRPIDTSSKLPVPVLQAEAELLGSIMGKATERIDDGAVVVFPAFARSLHNYGDYLETFPTRELSSEVIDGVAVAGPAKWVKSMTGSLKLLR